tara:strand:- start:233 stop:775 length:543 start_codon:yes stop_codon:yes gene_type:complete
MGKSSVSISEECISYIIDNLEEGNTILELGSGEGTVKLSNHFKMISIENQPEWQDKFSENTTYINVPDRLYEKDDISWWNKTIADFKVLDGFEDTGWYNPEVLLNQLPDKNDYDLILVDGPGGYLGRSGFLKYIEHFNTDVPIIIDDIYRVPENLMANILSEKLKKELIILADGCTGVIG